jgi:putative radical SAM enzyme (TIGR03279 family)
MQCFGSAAAMRVLEVTPQSPLFGHVRPGFTLVSINGRKVLDSIDYSFKLAEKRVRLVFADPKGEKIGFKFEYPSAEDIGLTLDDAKIRFCQNKCIFCFVHQQPHGMRKMLYVRDEDYRLSFTHGNFITLSNTTRADIQRIVKQRLSPLYVSVHATDNKLRRLMLGNKTLPPILPRLKYLTEHGITIHTQVVLCPEINDGAQLEKTITDLAGLYPGVTSLAVVPVGLTKFRDKLPKLRTHTVYEAEYVIDYIEKLQARFRKELGSRFVWAADEFYVQANREFPARSAYEDMPQFENGVGMAREFLTLFNRGRRSLKTLKPGKRVLMLTGESAYPFLSKQILPFLQDELRLDVRLKAVRNVFWGQTVTVSGLLTGQDLLRAARSMKKEFDTLVLPPNCLNNDDLFLDNLSLDQFRVLLGKEVLVGQYNLPRTIREVCQ